MNNPLNTHNINSLNLVRQNQEIAFIDTSITDWQKIVENMNNHIQVVHLDKTKDFIQQIADYTHAMSDISAIHIISHGSNGELDIGTDKLNVNNINDYQDLLKSIGNSMISNGDILLYGCNLAETHEGLEFLNQFSNFAGVDIAASNDLTGSLEKNGDWVLETNIGTIETDAVSSTSFSETLFTNANNIKDYNLSINLDMACISEAVYSNGKEARDLLSKAGWELHEAVSVRNAQSLCAVRENGDSKEMAIAFRGTEFGLTREGVLDLITDLTPWGFTNYYKAVRSSVEDWLIKAYLGNFDKIYFTGHSLGGVVAQIAMLDILENPNMDIWEQLTLTQDLNLLNAPLKVGDRFMDGQREDLKVAVREFVLDKVQGVTFGAPSISIDSPNVFANESLNWLQGVNVGNLADSALALVKNSLNEAFRLNSNIDLNKYKNNLQQFEHKVGVDEDYFTVLLEKIKDSGEAVSIVEFAQAQGWLPILDIIDGVQTLIDRVTLIGRLTYDMVKRYYNQEKLIELPTTHFDDPVAQLDSGKINSDESLAHIGSELGKLMNVMIDEKTYDNYLAHEGTEKGSFGSLMTLHAKTLYKESLLKLSAGENIIDFNSRLLGDPKSHSPQLISHSSATNGSDLLKNGVVIHGMDGNDVLVANGATTTMSGGSGSNIYVVKGAGSTITLQGSQNWHDSLYFVMHGELTTQVNGEALEITMTNMEGSRTVIIPNWYAKEGTQYQLNTIKTIKPSDTTGELFIDGAKTYFNQYSINEADRMTSLDIALLNQGGKKDDVILGSLTNDIMHGDAGDDNMSGRDGNDIIRGGAGNDTIDGGAGNDIIIDTEGYNTIIAGSGNDTITVARGEIKGGDGIDTLNSDFSSLSNFVSYGNHYGLQYRSSTAPNNLVDYTDSLEDVEGLISDSSAIISVYNSENNNDNYKLATWQSIEKSSITGTNKTGSYKGNDLIIVQGAGGTYKGGTAENYDTLYADWSKVTTAIKWDSNITTEQTLGNQVKVQGIERLLVRLGSGADVINNTNTTGDTIYAGAGNDNIKLGAGANTVDAGTGNDIVNIGTSNQWNTIYAGTGNDTITVARGEIKGGDGIDTLNSDFSSLSNFVSYGNHYGLQYRSSTAPNNLVDYTDSLEDVEGLISDSSAIISVYNSENNNDNYKLATWQSIEKSSITGTNKTGSYKGNDLIIVQGAGGTYKGGTAENYDTLYADWSKVTTAIKWDSNITTEQTLGNQVKVQGIERLLVRLGSGADVINNTNTTGDTIYAGAGNDNIKLGAGANTVDAGVGNDIINIGISSEWNTIYAGTGNDTITVARGEIKGGDGIDTLNSDFSSLSNFVSYGNHYGLQYRSSTAPNNLVDYTDSLEDVEGLISDSSAIISVYNSENNNDNYKLATWQSIEKSSITGTNKTGSYKGNDLIIVQGAGGTYKGGTAENYDTLYADWSASTQNINWNNQEQSLKTINGVKIEGMERLLLKLGSGSDTIKASSYDVADYIYGGAGNDTIYGYAGTDRLEGNEGNDTLIGGQGNDTLIGGQGHDIFKFSIGDGVDTIEDSSGTTEIHLNVAQSATTITNESNGVRIKYSANDSVFVANYNAETAKSLAYRIMYNDGTTQNLASLYYTVVEDKGRNNETNSTLTNTNKDEIIYGYGGNDIIKAGLGNDILHGGEGQDTADYTNINVSVNVNLNLSITQKGDGVSTDSLVDIENIIGSNFDDNLIGNNYDNIIDGRKGADVMVGDAGNDTYYVDNVDDKVVETTDAGMDIVLSSITYTLPSDVENLTLVGKSAISATGNTLANTLTGNSANNLINGGKGADTMIGGLGNDTYYVDHKNDKVVEKAKEGTDIVKSSVSFALSDHVENLTLVGKSAISATGNTLANTLTGNSANNLINGGKGADTMIGGLGNDTYYVDHKNDKVVEKAKEGTDTVKSSVSFALSDHVENLTLVGKSAINATGNTLSNKLIGNSANNVLNGGLGKDYLTGGEGADTFVFTNVNESSLKYSDVILDFKLGIDKIDLSAIDADISKDGNQSFTGLLTGNQSFTQAGQLKLSNNMLYGNTDNDSEAEFAIQLTDVYKLNLADIIL